MRKGLLVRTTGLAAGSYDLKNTRQPGLSNALLRIMQAVIRSIFGISEPQILNASPEQARCCSGVYACAVPVRRTAESTSAADKARRLSLG
jgi:hypothetical protein